MLVDAEHDEE